LRRERPANTIFPTLRKNLEETTMMTRRNFFLATAAGAAVLSPTTNLFAATYDLIIKGGHVIDPSLGIDEVRDLAISGGRIAAVEANIAGDATETIDARGKYVTPGLIDIHTHAGRGGAALALSDGVTAWVDAGSFGADGIDQAVANAAALPNMGRFLINIARTGVAPGGELVDLNRADVDLARGAIGRHRERESGTARLEEAVVAYRAALEEWTRERVPLDWAMSTGSQGEVLTLLAERRGDLAMAEQALGQITVAFETFRDAHHAPGAAEFEAHLPAALDAATREGTDLRVDVSAGEFLGEGTDRTTFAVKPEHGADRLGLLGYDDQLLVHGGVAERDSNCPRTRDRQTRVQWVIDSARRKFGLEPITRRNQRGSMLFGICSYA
jgi:hypothetical protein